MNIYKYYVIPETLTVIQNLEQAHIPFLLAIYSYSSSDMVTICEDRAEAEHYIDNLWLLLDADEIDDMTGWYIEPITNSDIRIRPKQQPEVT
jgi:hypothetical protein